MSKPVPVVRPGRRVSISNFGVGRTKQSFKAECDINAIMKRYEKSGVIAHVNRYQGKYGDFGNGLDYHEAMSRVVSAQQMFNSLNSTIRTRFSNSPELFLSFVSDSKNIPEMRELGLLPKEVAPEASPQTPPKAAPINPTNGT